MSDHIPFEIQVEIMKRLPIKSLIQFRSVSKPWKSVIESSNFITDYTVRNHHAQPQHLLIRYDSLSSLKMYVSIADDDNCFPLNNNNNKYPLTVPRSVNLLWNSFLIGTSHGLFCLFGYYRNIPDDIKYESGTAMAVVWNPTIRKSVAIAVPDVVWNDVGTTFGFGVCPATSDPKIVKIYDTCCTHSKMDSVTCSPWQVEVFSLRLGVWRVLSNNNLSDKLFEFNWPHSQVTMNGFIYWLGSKSITSDTRFQLVISFDLSSEEFREIRLPDEVVFHDLDYLFLFKRSDSLVVLQEWPMDDMYDVWMMENGDKNLFTKLFTIKRPNMSSLPLEYRRNGELMMRIIDDTEEFEALVVYEPFSEHINDLEIKGQCFSLRVSSYTESLLLLDQSSTLDDDEDDEEMGDDEDDEEMGDDEDERSIDQRAITSFVT